ncbi:peptidase family M3 [Massarina eburnea CBS 473.64]|uniref:Peptidase family M3 n=1 Tax=Massarina eburnea CBS 473.64 TaxID=1395130 RepID=A0A6A6RYP1_9PLEO|nr:peptidase family M3 [Massarina eburnea CBS 473.64]
MLSIFRFSLTVLLVAHAALTAVATIPILEPPAFKYRSKRQPNTSFTLTRPPQIPPVFNDTVSSLATDAPALCNQTKAVLDKLAATISPLNATFDNTYRPILNNEQHGWLRQWIHSFYASVSPDAALRNASNKASAVNGKCGVHANMRVDIFKLVESIQTGLNGAGDNSTVDAEDRYLVSKDYRGYLHKGLHLEGAARDQLKTIRTRIAHLKREYQNGSQNVPLMKEVVVKRDEAARLLGYPHHAALELESKMARNDSTVLSFLEGLRERLYDRGQEEIASLLAIKKVEDEKQNRTFDDSLDNGKRKYYTNILLKTQYSVDEAKLSEYFPLNHTISAMLQIFESLFNLCFVQLSAYDLATLSPTGSAKDMTWHEDVIAFAVWEGDVSGFVGYVYMDLYARDGKQTHCSEVPLQPGFLKANSKSWHYPVSAIRCSFPKPQGDKPTLMTHNQVMSLSHELGHSIHYVCTRTRWARLAKPAHDFVEVPSQMLENWMWTNVTLSQLSSHYKTNETLAPEMIEALISTKNVVEGGLNRLEKLALAFFDMAIHTPATHADAEALDFDHLYAAIMRNTTGLTASKDGSGRTFWVPRLEKFKHIIKAYDAGYYGYLWSEVYSTDMFHTAFKGDPMNPKIGERYRRVVLEKGGSQDEFVTLEQFLGRPPNSEAFHKELGLEMK